MEPLSSLEIKCKYCKYLTRNFNALREHFADKHPIEYNAIRLILKDDDDLLRKLTETDIIE